MTASQIPWKWTRRFAVGLTITVAAFSAWGAVAPHVPMAASVAPLAAGALLAALYGNSQGLANCMAANARRAWERGKGFRIPTIFFTACFAGFALLSMSGLHSAWEFVKINSGDAPLPSDGLMRGLFLFTALSEPAMNFGVEAMKAMHAVDQRREEREAFDDAAEREDRQRHAEARQKALHAVVAPAAAAAFALAPVLHAAALSARLEPASHSVPTGSEDSHRTHGWRGPRDQRLWARFIEAQELGLTPPEIIREIGVPPSTLYRWRSLLMRRQAIA